MIALYILLGLLLLLLIPVGIRLRFQSGLTATVRWAGIPVWRYDSEKEQKEKKHKPPKKDKPAGKKKEKPKKESAFQKLARELKEEGPGAAIRYLQLMAKFALGTLKRLWRRVHIGRCEAAIAIGGGDPDRVATEYGACAGPVAAAVSAARTHRWVKKLAVDLRPDFLGGGSRVALDLGAHAYPLAVLWALIRTLAAFVVTNIKWNIQNKQKGKDEKDG